MHSYVEEKGGLDTYILVWSNFVYASSGGSDKTAIAQTRLRLVPFAHDVRTFSLSLAHKMLTLYLQRF